MGMGNLLLLMGGDFEFFCLNLKNLVGTLVLVFFLVGMKAQTQK